MAMTMYSSSIPVLVRQLGNLSEILKKGAEHAVEHKLDERVLVACRLYPDMFPLSRQVQIACDVAKGCGARLSGINNPRFEDTELTFDELQVRIEKTAEFLQSLSADSIDGTEQKKIKLQAGPYELEFTGEKFLQQWVFPNVLFHITTAYNILRHNGVPVGKMDYLGAV